VRSFKVEVLSDVVEVRSAVVVVFRAVPELLRYFLVFVLVVLDRFVSPVADDTPVLSLLLSPVFPEAVPVLPVAPVLPVVALSVVVPVVALPDTSVPPLLKLVSPMFLVSDVDEFSPDGGADCVDNVSVLSASLLPDPQLARYIAGSSITAATQFLDHFIFICF
jgi:hypothetical protein